MLEMVGKAGDRSGRNEVARLSMLDDARAAGGARGDDGQPARPGFKRHIAEGFGDRRVEEDVARGERMGEIRAALKADEDRKRAGQGKSGSVRKGWGGRLN